MSSLNDYFKKNNIIPTEGYSQQVPGQIAFLRRTVSSPSIKRVMEIGFNGGHSAELFLSSNLDVEVVSFDIVSLNQEGELIINFDDVPNT